MASVTSYTKTGTKQERKVTLPKTVFDVDVNPELITQAYRTYLANGRSAGASTLTRGLVSGGGKKPWKQKGTGRARVGSTRVPQWRHGGIVFGPTGNENYTLNLPVKMKRRAIAQALSLKAKEGQVCVIEPFLTEGRVKPTLALIGKLGLKGGVVLVVGEKSDLLERATRNVADLEMVSAKYLNVYTVMNADHLLIISDALPVIETWLAASTKPEKVAS